MVIAHSYVSLQEGNMSYTVMIVLVDHMCLFQKNVIPSGKLT